MPEKEKKDAAQVVETAPNTGEDAARLAIFDGLVSDALAAEDTDAFIAALPKYDRASVADEVATILRRDAAGDVISAWAVSRLLQVVGEHVLKIARMRTYIFEDPKSAHPTDKNGATITLGTMPDYRETPRKNEPKPLRGDIAAAAAALVSSDALVSFLSNAVGITNEQAAYVLANVAESITSPPEK